MSKKESKDNKYFGGGVVSRNNDLKISSGMAGHVRPPWMIAYCTSRFIKNEIIVGAGICPPPWMIAYCKYQLVLNSLKYSGGVIL